MDTRMQTWPIGALLASCGVAAVTFYLGLMFEVTRGPSAFDDVPIEEPISAVQWFLFVTTWLAIAAAIASLRWYFVRRSAARAPQTF